MNVLLIPLRKFLKATRKDGYVGNLSTLHQVKDIQVNIKMTKCFTPINNLTIQCIHVSVISYSTAPFMYRVRQKYLTILKNSCEWNRWHGEFVLERPTSEAQSIWFAIESWSVEHRAFAVETYFENDDSVLIQRIFCRHFNFHRKECP